MPRDTSSDFHFLIGRSCRLNDIRVGVVGGEGLLVPLPKERNASIVLFTSAYRVKSRFSARVTRDLPLSSEFLRPIVLICHRKSLPSPRRHVFIVEKVARQTALIPSRYTYIHHAGYRDYLNFDPPRRRIPPFRVARRREEAFASRHEYW